MKRMHCKQVLSKRLIYIIIYLLWPHVWHTYSEIINKTRVFQMNHFLWPFNFTPGAAEVHKTARPSIFKQKAALYQKQLQ